MNNELDNVEEIISPVTIDEQLRLMIIDNSAIVKMTQVGYKMSKGNSFLGMPISDPKVMQERYFRLVNKFTMEYVENSTAEQLGNVLKRMFNEIQKSINNYEKQASL